jgi:uncharacterized glyoxalase superfamily protein PhnB
MSIRPRLVAVLATALAVALPAVVAAQPSTRSTPMTTSAPTAASYAVATLSPVLIVDAVEPSVAFWTERLGFEKDNEVPGPDGKLVFASVKKDGVEIMYQTRASVVAEDPASAAELNGRSAALFIMVPSVHDLDTIERRVAGAPMVKPRHDTFYGTTEFYIREPGGNVVGFSARK